jgi:hypothetical protein
MGCNCKNKKKRVVSENANPAIKKQKEEQVIKLKESIRKQLINFRRLTK